MNESILTSTKASLGLPEEHEAFDAELVLHINSVLSDLEQLGVGPSDGIEITGKDEEWMLITGDNPRYNMVKSYVHLRVKTLFDPPQVGFVITAMKDQIEKMEFRIMVLADPPVTTVEDDDIVADLILDGGGI